MGSDPYQRWLNIPPDQRPPSPWDLLGLSEGETDEQKIHEALNQRYQHVRTYTLGPEAEDAHRILGELSQALNTLLARNRQSRHVVDPVDSEAAARLYLAEEGSRSEPATEPQETPHATAEGKVVPPLLPGQSEPVETAKPTPGFMERFGWARERTPAGVLALSGVGVSTLALLLLLGMGMFRGGTTDVTLEPIVTPTAGLVITSDGGGLTAAKSVPEQTAVITTVLAGEADAPVFAIAGGADALMFTIDPASGVLTFVSPPDYEDPADEDGDNQYEVSVTVRNEQGEQAQQTICVTVTDENDSPQITSHRGQQTIDVMVSEKSTTVTTVAAADQDSTTEALTFNLSGTDSGCFTLDSGNGSLAFIAPPVHSQPKDADGDNVYEVTVEVSDDRGGRTAQAFRVSVEAVNPPTFTSNDGVALVHKLVLENVTEVATFAASGEATPADPLKFTIEGPDAASFEINGYTGELRFLAAPDHERPADLNADNQYQLRVRVSDHYGQTAEQTVFVHVLDVAESLAVITNSIGMELVLIPPGQFMMGSPDSETYSKDDERPQHLVRITRGFYLGRTEVTQQQYQLLTGETPSRFKGDFLPVEQVSWDDAVEFCQRLGLKEGRRYRLPTEAEWEYACRAGSTSMWSCGDNPSELESYAVTFKNSRMRTQPVGSMRANPWLLRDMHGNVREWVADWYSFTYYRSLPTDDPVGPGYGQQRVYRGGSGADGYWDCRSAARGPMSPARKYNDLGFRVALDPSD